MPKRPIREQLLSQRRSCPADVCLRLSRSIQQRFLQSECYRSACCVVLYSPIHNEVDTGLVAQQVWRDGKRLAYPRVVGETLQFVAVARAEELQKGRFGILEPAGDQVVGLAEIAVLVVPGVAFDLQGHRLGYGKGYYDRMLERCAAHTSLVGFAYDFQVVPTLPIEGHDRPLNWLITETRMVRFAP